MYTRKCIKCTVQYEDEQDEDYYCPSCLEKKNQIAEEVNKKVHPMRAVESNMEKYNSLPKIHGFPSAKEFGL